MNDDVIKHRQSLSRRTFLQRSAVAVTGTLGITSGARSAPDLTRSGPWQIGCYTRVFDRWEYRVGLDAIAEAGYRYAGLMTTKQTPDQKWVLITSETSME